MSCLKTFRVKFPVSFFFSVFFLHTRTCMKVWVFLFCASPVGGSSALCLNSTSASITQNTRTHDPPTVQQLPHLIIPSSSSIPLSKSVSPNCNMHPISGEGGRERGFSTNMTFGDQNRVCLLCSSVHTVGLHGNNPSGCSCCC